MMPERDKREILENSPLLFTFLNDRMSSALWVRALQAAASPLKDKIKEKIGENWEHVLVATLGSLSITFEVFSEMPSKQAKAGMVGTLFLIGYESGNLDDISLFSGEIVKQMYDLEFLKEEIHHNEDYKDKLARFLFGSVYAGVLLRNELDPATRKSLSQDIPQVFKDFMEGLDI